MRLADHSTASRPVRAARVRLLAAALAATMVPIYQIGVAPAAVAVAPKALINADSVSGSPSIEQQEAEAQGFAVQVVTGSEWGAMTQAQFAQYQVLVVGDRFCETLAPSVTSNAATWAPVHGSRGAEPRRQQDCDWHRPCLASWGSSTSTGPHQGRYPVRWSSNRPHWALFHSGLQLRRAGRGGAREVEHRYRVVGRERISALWWQRVPDCQSRRLLQSAERRPPRLGVLCTRFLHWVSVRLDAACRGDGHDNRNGVRYRP